MDAVQWGYLALDEAVEAVVDAEHPVPLGEAESDERADGGVHATRWGADVHHRQVARRLQQREKRFI